MNRYSRYLGTSLLLALSLSLLACQEKTAKNSGFEPSTPVAINPGMRAYVDPVTGEYAPAPPQTEQPKPYIPAAGVISPDSKPSSPKEIPLPDGGVMIELGDQFQTKGQAPK